MDTFRQRPDKKSTNEHSIIYVLFLPVPIAIAIKKEVSLAGARCHSGKKRDISG